MAHRGKPTVLGAASGIVAGLVCITPAAGFVNPMPALVMGVCGRHRLRLRLQQDQGEVRLRRLAGRLRRPRRRRNAGRDPDRRVRHAGGLEHRRAANTLGLIEGGTACSSGQLVAVAVTWVFSIVATFIILKVLDAVMGLRVSQQDETAGLDVSQHGEEGYIFV